MTILVTLGLALTAFDWRLIDSQSTKAKSKFENKGLQQIAKGKL